MRAKVPLNNFYGGGSSLSDSQKNILHKSILHSFIAYKIFALLRFYDSRICVTDEIKKS